MCFRSPGKRGSLAAGSRDKRERPRGDVSRADLLEIERLLGASAAERYVRARGGDVREPEPDSPREPVVPPPPVDPPGDEEVAVTPKTPTVLHWRPTRIQFHSPPPKKDRRPAPHLRDEEMRGDGEHRSRVAPATPPLGSSARFLGQLRDGVFRLRPGRRIDEAETVRRWARGDRIERFPVRARRNTHLAVHVVMDESLSLRPLLEDRDRLLTALLAAQEFDVRSVFRVGRGLTPAAAVERGIAPLVRRGEVVLAVSDLGVFAGASSRANWTSAGRAARELALGCCAFVPLRPDRLPTDLHRYWNCLPFGSAPREAEHPHAETELLLALIVDRLRVEPGLLRALRQQFCGAAAGVEHELAVWNHPSCQSDDVGTQLLGEVQEEARARWKELDDATKEAVEELCEAWEAHLPPELGHVSLLFRSVTDPEFFKRAGSKLCDRLEVARDFASRSAGSLARTTGADTGNRALSAFLGRLNIENGVSVGRSAELATAAFLRSGRGSGERPGPAVDVDRLRELLSPDETRSLRIDQDRTGWRVTPADASREEHQGTSPVAYLESGWPEVLVRTNPDESGPGRPHWSDDYGIDEYGPWATFRIGELEVRLRWIPPGEFRMGSPADEPGRRSQEFDLVPVRISEGFWLGETPCTQDLWEEVMGSNPSRFRSPRRPVEEVSAGDVEQFLELLNGRQNDGSCFLPTEAQWEYACRAGTEGATYAGSMEILGLNHAPALDSIAWYGGNSGVGFDLHDAGFEVNWSERQHEFSVAGTRLVGQKEPNPWGLQDMLGNVDEWCSAWLAEDGVDRVDPKGQPRGAQAVVRGGSWSSYAWSCRAACRYAIPRGDCYVSLGFRLARGHSAPAGQFQARFRQAESARPKVGREPRGTQGELARRTARADGAAEELGFLALPDEEVVEVGEPRRVFVQTDSVTIEVEPFERPRWAPDCGRDRHGLWVECALAGVPMRMRWIPPGRFRMGSPEVEPGRSDREGPDHDVLITRGYWLAETPCTQELWEAVMGSDRNTSRFQGPERPVENVSYDDVQEFLRLTPGRFSGEPFRLPSEAEWEYACRAGSSRATYSGPMEILDDYDAPVLDEIAWYGGNSGEAFDLDMSVLERESTLQILPHGGAGSRKVGTKSPNAWGLSDMLGNVHEWCADDLRGYTSELVRDPLGDLSSHGAVVRGGSWSSLARGCRAACRGAVLRGGRSDSLGFRLARGHSAPASPARDRGPSGEARGTRAEQGGPVEEEGRGL